MIRYPRIAGFQRSNIQIDISTEITEWKLIMHKMKNRSFVFDLLIKNQVKYLFDSNGGITHRHLFLVKKNIP